MGLSQTRSLSERMRCARSLWISAGDGQFKGYEGWVACGGLCPPSAPPPAEPPSPPSTPCQTVVVALWNPSESWEGIKLVLDGVEADISSDGPDGNYGTCPALFARSRLA